MTKKQHRKNKAQRLQNKDTYNQVCNERPEWANDEKLEKAQTDWKTQFLQEVREAISIRDSLQLQVA